MVVDSWRGCYEEGFSAAVNGFHREAIAAGFEVCRYVYSGTASGTVPEPVLPADIGRGGGDDQRLCCSVARRGPRRAARVLIVVSGTHGAEGYFGSAAQRGFLRSGLASRLAPDVAVLLIHALNPWGFAHGRRTTEENVDLNRNFVDWSQPRPRNDRYGELHRALKLTHTPGAGFRLPSDDVADWIAQHGNAAYMDVLGRGQYTHPDGMFYGGDRPTWSSRVLAEILEAHCEHPELVAVVDWHTGIGRYASPYFLCFNDPGSELWRLCAAWWGEAPLRNQDGFDGAERPRYTGLVFDGIVSLLPHSAVAGCVIEIGTYPPEVMIDALRQENCLNTSPPSARIREEVGAWIRERFYPSDPYWRRRALEWSMDIHAGVIGGIGSR